MRSTPVRPCYPLLWLPAALLRQRIKGPRLKLRHVRVTLGAPASASPRATAVKRNRIVYVIFFIIHKVQLAYTLTQHRQAGLLRKNIITSLQIIIIKSSETPISILIVQPWQRLFLVCRVWCIKIAFIHKHTGFAF